MCSIFLTALSFGYMIGGVGIKINEIRFFLKYMRKLIYSTEIFFPSILFLFLHYFLWFDWFVHFIHIIQYIGERRKRRSTFSRHLFGIWIVHSMVRDEEKLCRINFSLYPFTSFAHFIFEKCVKRIYLPRLTHGYGLLPFSSSSFYFVYELHFLRFRYLIVYFKFAILYLFIDYEFGVCTSFIFLNIA